MKEIMKIMASVLLILGVSLSNAQTISTTLVDSEVSNFITKSSDIGVFTMKFSVTAENTDVYIDIASGFNWLPVQVSPVPGNPLEAQSTTTLVSGVIWDQDSIQISEGDSAILNLTTLIEPQVSGLYRVKVDSLSWSTSPGGALSS